MPGLEFSVPFNGDEQTLSALLAMRQRGGNFVREVYMGVPQSITGSGRAGLDTTDAQFEDTVERIHAAGVRVDLTMNSTCEGSDWYSAESVGRIVDFVARMHESHGVEAVTLANPFYVAAVRESCPDLEISASVLADVDCFSRAEAFTRAGASTVTVDTSINRDIKLLGQIVDRLGVEIKLMVNEGCLNKCPYRKFHMNYISHRSRESRTEDADFSFACGDIIAGDPGSIFKSNWVRPEELSRYRGVTKYFKIVGRDMLASKVLRCVGAYMDENYDGNLLDLLCSSIGFYNVEHSAFIDNKALDKSAYFKRLSTCNRKCHTCSYCSDLAKQYLRYGRITEENLLDMGQYQTVAMVKAQCGGRFPRCGDYSMQPRISAETA